MTTEDVLAVAFDASCIGGAIYAAWNDWVPWLAVPLVILLVALSRVRPAVNRIREENHEWQASFDLRWKADCRARERWQAAHPDQPLTWPDHADMCVWLMEQLEARSRCYTPDEVATVQGALDSLASALTQHGHQWTEGERAIYEDACTLLGNPPFTPPTEDAA